MNYYDKKDFTFLLSKELCDDLQGLYITPPTLQEAAEKIRAEFKYEVMNYEPL